MDAASLYMAPNTSEIKRGDTVAIAVRLDTDEDECVNVVDGVITYTNNIEPVDVSRGNSIFSVWVEEPIIDKQNKTITFAGGIPNGYCGRIPGDPRLTNTVVELLFRSPGMVIGGGTQSKVAEINFSPQTRVLLNDGFGTDAQTSFFGAQLTLSDKVGNTISNEWNDRVIGDTTPPQEFSIFLEKNPNAFSGRYYIVFNTTDKQSGIDHYEVIEEPLDSKNLFGWGAETAPWVTAKSPYILDDQSLNSAIRVRAIDKAGNEYVATLVPEESQRTLSTEGLVMLALIAVALVVLLVVAGISLFFVRGRKKKEEEDSIGEIS